MDFLIFPICGVIALFLLAVIIVAILRHGGIHFRFGGHLPPSSEK